MDKNEELDEHKVIFLHPHGLSASFSFPIKPDMLWIPIIDVLYIVDHLTLTGRTYLLSENNILKTKHPLIKFYNKKI